MDVISSERWLVLHVPIITLDRYAPSSALEVVLCPKINSTFSLSVQNYVTETLIDRSFKPSFQEETCLFWL